ncbi:hypothetical protein SLEP1_g48324 [Rubroshorea leprosula]|uniref:Uncharacterized protein n=1 Tax=Rubroshorea leprosula TaxID=152421 RepID=A0AAV5LT81_9ROSI|nr:hypothetical protein SLEP1_g48324 [Rubroshorea leprosula]
MRPNSQESWCALSFYRRGKDMVWVCLMFGWLQRGAQDLFLQKRGRRGRKLRDSKQGRSKVQARVQQARAQQGAGSGTSSRGRRVQDRRSNQCKGRRVQGAQAYRGCSK